MKQFTLPQNSFLLLLTIVTIAFLWILLPYSGAVFWGVVFAIIFAPLQSKLLRATKGKPTVAALLSLLVIVLMVLLPLAMITASLVDQVAGIYTMVSSGQIDFAHYFEVVMRALPNWAISILERFELTNLASLQTKITEFAAQISMTIMLYLLFFLLRDGRILAARIQRAVPLSVEYKSRLFQNFTTVIRATVKGNVLVAVAQGALGGLIFWMLDVSGPLLWGVVMAFLSLLPAIGAALVWGPVAIYFLVTGAIWQGVVLAAYGVLVIGLVDNILRPILVGKDTKLPDYVILLSTLGGMALFGLNGFVIGPVIAALFIAAWDLFCRSDEFQEE
jgi:predicted PurR-regulated permease PerM